jgi:hypothetical protein
MRLMRYLGKGLVLLGEAAHMVAKVPGDPPRRPTRGRPHIVRLPRKAGRRR